MSEFDDATYLADDGSGVIHDGWDINGNANGGYLMALATRGMRALAGRPDPISVTGHYLSPGKPGTVQLDGSVVKRGRRFATVAAGLRHDDTTLLQLVPQRGR